MTGRQSAKTLCTPSNTDMSIDTSTTLLTARHNNYDYFYDYDFIEIYWGEGSYFNHQDKSKQQQQQ
jgi:hypothetical protein